MRDFLKQTLSTLLALCIFTGVGIGGLFILVLMIAIGSSQGGEPNIPQQAILTIDMGQSIEDSEPEVSARELIQNGRPNVMPLRTMVQAITAAAEDKRITGILLFSRNSAVSNESSYANLKEVRRSLEKFKAAGKKIYAYDVDWQEREYYLASIADQIGMNPMGSLELNGLSSETMFYSGALQKYGIGVQAIWRGKYKSAIEPWVRTNRSEASRQQTAKLLGDLWQEFLQSSSKNRQLDPKAMQQLSNSQGILSAQAAQQAKLVDKLIYTDQIIDELKGITGEDKDSKSFNQISLADYAQTLDSSPGFGQRDQIAVVYANGAIVNGQGGPGLIGGDRLASQLRQLRQDEKVKAIVLRVNSPGGSATASDIIQREVIQTQKRKPVVISMGGVAASGGYWISTYADKIFAEPNTITGSIGVFGLQPNVQKLANQNGITWDVVKTGKFADSLTISRPKNEAEIALIQRIVGQIYDQFLTKVAESRKLDKAKVGQIAQGRVWSGIEAQKIGLVDELGGLNQAITAAAKLAKLGDDWRVEEYPTAKTLEQRLLQSLFGTKLKSLFPINLPPQDVFSHELQRLGEDFEQLQTLNDPRGIYMRMPENLRIR